MGTAPENTLVSFRRALQDGAQCVELDVHGTRDGEVVIIHDGTLERTTNGRGRVRRKTVPELRTLDAGYRFTLDALSYPFRGKKIGIPTLAEFLTAFPQAKAIIEIKQARPSIAKKVMEIVFSLRSADRVLLATEKDSTMREIRAEIAARQLSVATGFSRGEVASFLDWIAGGKKPPYTPPGQALLIPCRYRSMTLVTAETVEAAHQLGLEVFVWTVNEADEMRRLLGLGVDGIITDYPARLRDLILGQGSIKS